MRNGAEKKFNYDKLLPPGDGQEEKIKQNRKQNILDQTDSRLNGYCLLCIKFEFPLFCHYLCGTVVPSCSAPICNILSCLFYSLQNQWKEKHKQNRKRLLLPNLVLKRVILVDRSVATTLIKW